MTYLYRNKVITDDNMKRIRGLILEELKNNKYIINTFGEYYYSVSLKNMLEGGYFQNFQNI